MAITPRAASEQLSKTRFAASSDFAELISQEVYVDLERLRFLALHGVPEDRDQSLRSSVWKILLPTLSAGFDLTPTPPREDASLPGDVETAKLIREALDVYQLDEPFFGRGSVRSKIEKICSQYHSDHPNGFASRDPKLLVYLYGPFIFTCRRSGSEQMFYMFMEMLERHNTFEAKEKSYRRFMSLFRAQLPQLCAHFEDEELDPRKWVTTWHQGLFARQLPFRCLLRLWDSYFSIKDRRFDMHLYVCLAVLKSFENDLVDKTYPELRAFMERIPALDIEKTVAQAQNFQSLE